MTIVLTLIVVAAGAAWWFLNRQTDEDRYLAALSRGGFEKQYATPEVAIASGHAFCGSLAGGAKPQGFDYQQVAVVELCSQFKLAFKVVPTPAQQAATYTKLLRSKGLGGKFASDAAAVAHAQATCKSLDGGAPQQGPAEDAVAVSVYCVQYVSGFKTLYPIKVHGTFTLYDSSPSSYFPLIGGQSRNCTGISGYSDVSRGVEVNVKNDAGLVLTTANLGQGHGSPPYSCVFPFTFTVMDGENGGYMIAVGNRGSVHFTAAQLKLPDGAQLTLGN